MERELKTYKRKPFRLHYLENKFLSVRFLKHEYCFYYTNWQFLFFTDPLINIQKDRVKRVKGAGEGGLIPAL